MNPSLKSTAISERSTLPFGGKSLAGFTLVELLVSIVILGLVLAIVGVMIATVSQLIGDARKLLSSDDQARLAFTRMASDFSRMLTRKDVDIIFAKQSGSTSAGANDSIYFITEASGSNNTSAYSSSTANLLTLAGYCIAPDAQGTQINPNIASPVLDLVRLGHALTWDTVTAGNTTPDNLVFVSFAAPTTASTTSALVTGTTLDGHWGVSNASLGASLATLGSSPTYTPPTTSSNYGDYHSIADQIFRFEYCFLLKDGTYSNVPIIIGNGPRYNNAASGPPAPTNDNSDTSSGTAGTVSTKYGTGSRWFDKTNGRAFICSDANKNTATWGPLGVQDVSAIVVAIALFDRDSRMKITSASTLNNLPAFFADSLQNTTATATSLTALPSASAPILMQQNWQATVDSPMFFTAAGLTASAAGHIRIYQRYFYLNANNL